MNMWQLLRQIQFLLRAQTWDGTNIVFADESVRVTAAFVPEDLRATRPPWAFLSPADGTTDDSEELAKYMIRNVVVTLLAYNENDAIGEAVLLGANRLGQDNSEGRGLLEVEEMLFSAISALNRGNGVRIEYRANGQATPESLGEDFEETAVRNDYLFEAAVSAQRYYASTEDFVYTTPSGGGVVMTWRNPATRFDTRRVALVRKPGATAPTSITDGTELTLSSATAESHTDTPGSGTWSYSLFMAYDEYGSGTDERFSDVNSQAGIVVS